MGSRQPLPPRQAHHDVVVVGAGPAGSATAYFLARAGLNVALFDKATFPRDKTCGDALSPRSQHMLAQMGLLDQVAAQAHHAHAIHLYAPNAQRATTCLAADPVLPGQSPDQPLHGPAHDPNGSNGSHRGAGLTGSVAHGSAASPAMQPGRTLILPRQTLDHMLQDCAVAAGARFRVARVAGVLRRGRQVVGVETSDGATYPAALVVLATGASTSLLEGAGLLPRRPRFSVAARRYYTGIADLEPQLEFYFNQVPLPGYSWLFPTGPDSANIGLWYRGGWPLSARAALAPLLREHPRLRRLLAGAQASGPLKSYPLRTDFLTAPRLQHGLLAVGEAVGLVNPFTGEGIDYALESGQLAAQTIGAALAVGEPTAARLQPYGRQLNARFGKLFLLMTLAQHCYSNAPVFNRIFGRPRPDQYVIDTLIRTCFGTNDPAQVIAPRFLLGLLRAAV